MAVLIRDPDLNRPSPPVAAVVRTGKHGSRGRVENESQVRAGYVNSSGKQSAEHWIRGIVLRQRSQEDATPFRHSYVQPGLRREQVKTGIA